MYRPSLFRDDDPARARALIDAHPFAIVVAPGAVPEVAHLPCALEDSADGPVVRMHVAIGNPLASHAKRGATLTAVFRGPHAYVSPSWYERPSEQVPTWNYAVVHASGPARVMGAPELLASLRALAARFDGPDGWSPDAMEPGLFEQIARGVVGIEIAIESLEGKYKLSQNRSTADHARVREALAASEDIVARAVAALMVR